MKYKFIHKCYQLTLHYTTKFKADVDVNSSFCKALSETLLHLLWICSHTRIFWKDLTGFIIANKCNDEWMRIKSV